MKSFDDQLLEFHSLIRRRNAYSMSARQFAKAAAIARGKSMLVFGSGLDTPFWTSITSSLIVLEDDPEWIVPVEGAEIVRVCYQGRVGKRLENPEAFLTQIGHVPWTWKVILVDGPKGYEPTGPGRQESIFVASHIRSCFGATVMVHDYQRQWERTCCDGYLRAPDEVVASGRTRDGRLLAIWK